MYHAATAPAGDLKPGARFCIQISETAKRQEKKMSDVLTFTDENFQAEVLQSKEPVLVDFWAVWCMPCRAIAPVVDQLATEFKGRAKVGKLNVDENIQVASRYGIRSIPTLLIFKDGKPVDQIIGVQPKAKLAEALERAIG